MIDKLNPLPEDSEYPHEAIDPYYTTSLESFRHLCNCHHESASTNDHTVALFRGPLKVPNARRQRYVSNSVSSRSDDSSHDDSTIISTDDSLNSSRSSQHEESTFQSKPTISHKQNLPLRSILVNRSRFVSRANHFNTGSHGDIHLCPTNHDDASYQNRPSFTSKSWPADRCRFDKMRNGGFVFSRYHPHNRTVPPSSMSNKAHSVLDLAENTNLTLNTWRSLKDLSRKKHTGEILKSLPHTMEFHSSHTAANSLSRHRWKAIVRELMQTNRLSSWNQMDVKRPVSSVASRGMESISTRSSSHMHSLSHSDWKLATLSYRKSTASAAAVAVDIESYDFTELINRLLTTQPTLSRWYRAMAHCRPLSPMLLLYRGVVDGLDPVTLFFLLTKGTHEYMRAVTNYQSNDASLLSFKKGDIIRIIKKSHGSQQGWLFGILEGRRGLISSDCVVAVQKPPINSGRKLLGTGSNSAITAGTTAAGNNGADSDASGGSPASDAHITGAVTSSDWLTRDVTEPVDRQVASPVGGPQSPVSPTLVDDGKHSLLQFAMLHFRDADEKYNMLRSDEGETAGSSVKHDTKHKKSKKKSKTDWTWREQVEMVKWTSEPLSASLLKLESAEMNRLALDCFGAVQRYMGEQAMPQGTSEVDCVYAILMSCHRYPTLCDEVYCQLMRQTTSNRSQHADSCQRGWRLLGIVAAYFTCSDQLRPYLFKYLETAAYDKRRAYHGTALVCLHNLRKTVRYGGRKNVPSVEEITAVTAGRNSKRQLYRLPGGTERVINTKSCSVVQDIIEEICEAINITNAEEVNEYSLYCIVEGDTFTMPLAREEYILDVTTELQKNDQIFYLIFCRSVWFFPLRLDSQLYVEVVFNQITPDYLEGLLLVMPGETLQEQTVYDISRVAALLHRAADMETVPSMKETKYLLPKAALMVRDIKPPQWVNMVQSSWSEVQHHTGMQSKTAVLEILQNWPLFGSSFFAVSRMIDNRDAVEHILALNRAGVHFLDTITHETLAKYPFSEVISTRKVKTEDGTLFLDMKCGNLMMQKVVRIQSDNAHEISRLIRQYISIEQRQRSSLVDTAAVIADSSREGQASR